MAYRNILGAFATAFLLLPATACLAENADTSGSPPHAGIQTVQAFLETLPFTLHGYLDGRGGFRTQNDFHQNRDLILGEVRLQLEATRYFEWSEWKAKVDILYDGADREPQNSIVDLREANVLLFPFDFLDIKIGRQILTWGTGDLVFINDAFPKDFLSFFIGRDVEYLKAPSDALKASLYTDLANVDFVLVPQFDPDRDLNGERLSYYNPLLGRRAGGKSRRERVNEEKPDSWFNDAEFHVRVHRNLKGYEIAAYGYYGFWKLPYGFDVSERKSTYPKLVIYGGSIRGKLWKGIGNVEFGYYDSREDRKGSNPFIPNAEWRLLGGYEQELPFGKDLTMGVQYYVEGMTDYNAYRATTLGISPARDKYRHVLTLRLTKLLLNQNLKLSLFTFYSPTDTDIYLRPHIVYKVTDSWSVETGANVFAGEHEHTTFGQFERNGNIYAASTVHF